MEIGSEFWLEEPQSNIENENIFNFGKDIKYLMSGRTAIDYVIKEIKKSKVVKNIYFPSYCCESMLEPFIKNNIKINFYNVDFDGRLEYNIDINFKCDIFFAMSYFGYESTRMDTFIEKFKSRNVIVIEDITHSLLSKKAFSQDSDYLVASLRKWFPIISGGIAVNMNSKFLNNELKECPHDLMTLKKEAMLLKKDYIDGKTNIKKEAFLEKYKLSNRMLKDNYKDFKIDTMSLSILQNTDMQKLKNVRFNNALIIQEMLKNANNINLMIRDFKKGDVPLFVPIILDSNIKNLIQKFLIDNQIYCPSHWPKPNLINDLFNELYENEISLICDQRYTNSNINEYMKKMIEFSKGV